MSRIGFQNRARERGPLPDGAETDQGGASGSMRASTNDACPDDKFWDARPCPARSQNCRRELPISWQPPLFYNEPSSRFCRRPACCCARSISARRRPTKKSHRNANAGRPVLIDRRDIAWIGPPRGRGPSPRRPGVSLNLILDGPGFGRPWRRRRGLPNALTFMVGRQRTPPIRARRSMVLPRAMGQNHVQCRAVRVTGQRPRSATH